MNALTNWLAAHKISSHTLVIVLGAITAAYEADPAVQALVNAFFVKHPHLALWAGFASSVYFIYKRSQKSTQAAEPEKAKAANA